MPTHAHPPGGAPEVRAVPEASIAPPALDDPRRFVKRAAVPVLDIHRHDIKGDVDENTLQLIAENSNRRAAEGKLAILTLGHTNDSDDEISQPPPVGLARNFVVGRYDGRPCLLADLYVEADKAPVALGSFPFRSVERVKSPTNPNLNYIDYIAFLRRNPERPLGLLYSDRAGLPAGCQVVRYSSELPSPGTADADPPSPEASPMDEEKLVCSLVKALVPAIKELLDGKAAEGDAESADKADADTEKYDDAAPSSTDVSPVTELGDDDKEKERMSERSPAGTAGTAGTSKPGGAKAPAAPATEADVDRVRYEEITRNQSRVIAAQGKQIEGLKGEVTALTRRLDDQANATTRERYSSTLKDLERAGFEFDHGEELDALMALGGDDKRETHINKIRTRYRQSPVGQRGPEVAATGQGERAVTQADIDGIARLIEREPGLKDWDSARARYFELIDKGAIKVR